MQTRSVDVAAYLHMNGVDPVRVILDQRWKVRQFHYENTEMVRALVRAYDNGGMVPAKEFAEARSRVKRLGASKGVHHKRGALERVKRQLRIGDEEG